MASRASEPDTVSMAEAKVQGLIQEFPLVVFSKLYCPYCRNVKELFRSLGVEPKIVELDLVSDGPEMQKALLKITGQRTVPNSFVGGEHIGGADVTKALHKKGALIPLLKKHGVLTDNEEEEPVPVIAQGGIHDLLEAGDAGGSSAGDVHAKRVVSVD